MRNSQYTNNDFMRSSWYRNKDVIGIVSYTKSDLIRKRRDTDIYLMRDRPFSK